MAYDNMIIDHIISYSIGKNYELFTSFSDLSFNNILLLHNN